MCGIFIFILEGIEIYCTFNRQQLATEGGKVKKKIKMCEILELN